MIDKPAQPGLVNQARLNGRLQRLPASLSTSRLRALNLQTAANVEHGSPVTAPGVPKNYPDARKLVTEDGIRPSG